MKIVKYITLCLLVITAAGFAACDNGASEAESILAQPKTYVGSEQCKVCHLEHFDSWKMTLHSRTIQDVTVNRDAIITDINPAVIRADLKKQEADLKVPVDSIYIPEVEEIKYTLGVQWKQRYLIEKNGQLLIAPIQYNAWTNTWTSYYEAEWERRPWIKKCGGCHAMGVDISRNTFVEPAVGCEGCHGPGSHHVALPKAAVFQKRLTIVNPSKLSAGIRTQICGTCHSSGVSTRAEGVDWPVDHRPGQALGPFFTSVVFKTGQEVADVSGFVPDGHHQQYDDWLKSVHAIKGVSCTSCHYVHQLGVPPTQFQTKGSGSQQCLMCHTVINSNSAHSIHSFANCVGCHMPRVARSPESGDALSHSFKFLYPRDSIEAGGVKNQPNACSNCHHHEDTPLEVLDGFLEAAKKRDMPLPFSAHRRTGQLE